MKIHRFSLFVTLFALASILLSACSGTVYHTWPGVTASQDIVYLANQGSIYAINAGTGAEVWRFPQKPEPSKPFFAAPAVADGLIVVGNYGHQLYALDTNGQAKWTAPFDPGVGNFSATPLITKDLILAPSSNNTLYALDMSGKLRWKFESKNMLWATPASDGTLAFVPALDHNLYALKLSDGSKAWEKDLGSALQSAPLLTEDGTLYINTMAGEVYALKAQDGSSVWKASAGGRLWSTPLLNKDTLYVGSDNGKITAIAAKDGSITWQKTTAGSIIGGGALVTDGVAFPLEGGNVVAWSLDGQKQLWNPTINGKLYTTPAVAGQNLVVAVTEGDKQLLLQGFSMSGQPTWQFILPK